MSWRNCESAPSRVDLNFLGTVTIIFSNSRKIRKEKNLSSFVLYLICHIYINYCSLFELLPSRLADKILPLFYRHLIKNEIINQCHCFAVVDAICSVLIRSDQEQSASSPHPQMVFLCRRKPDGSPYERYETRSFR